MLLILSCLSWTGWRCIYEQWQLPARSLVAASPIKRDMRGAVVRESSAVPGALEFGGAPAVALAALLQIGKTLDSENFGKRVVPPLSRLFTSTDRSIRRSLLENIDVYGPHLDQVPFFTNFNLKVFVYIPQSSTTKKPFAHSCVWIIGVQRCNPASTSSSTP